MCVHVCKCVCMCVRGLRLTLGIFQSLSILLLLHQFVCTHMHAHAHMDSAHLPQRVWQSEDGSQESVLLCGFQGENSGHPTRRQVPLPPAHPDWLSTIVLSLNVELAVLVKLTCWGAPGSPAPASLGLGFQIMLLHGFTYWKSKLKSLCLRSKHTTN